MAGEPENNCLFCSICAGKIPSKKVYEDQNVLAILDIHPANPGHILLLTKNHYTNLSELPDYLTGYIFVIVKAISKVIHSNMELDGVNVLLNQGEAAGQISTHFMIHIIPRFKGDSLNFKWEPKELEEEDLNKIVDAMKKTPIEVEQEKKQDKVEEQQEKKKINIIKNSNLAKQLERMP